MRPADLVAKEDIPELFRYGDRLLLIVETTIADPVRYNVNDSMAFMLVSLLSRQYSHYLSIRTLVGAQHGRDAVLIARTAMEGMALILWALKEPESRAERWRGFIYVMEFKQMLRRERNGQRLSIEEEEVIRE